MPTITAPDTVSEFQVRFAQKSDVPTILALIRELAENPALTVDLQGYTDSTGPVEYNVELSDRRVSSVRRFLAAPLP